ncbi:MAG: HEAT repeat domain-containing protein [Planctomycetota bacterium]|nr:HEAT repeat domain-containing protein [Planctomycetota bacterium]
MAKSPLLILSFFLFFAGCKDKTTAKQKSTQNEGAVNQSDSPSKSAPTVENAASKTRRFQNCLSDSLSADTKVAKSSIAELKSAGPDVVPFLIGNIQNRQPKLREIVFQILLDKKNALEVHIDVLIKAFENNQHNLDTRTKISKLFLMIGKKDLTSKALARSCQPGPINMKPVSLEALKTMGKDASPAIPELITALDKAGHREFQSILMTLEAIACSESKEWFVYLTKTLPTISYKQNYKLSLFKSFNKFGDQTIPTLVLLIGHSNFTLNNMAKIELQKYGSKVVPSLVNIMEDNQSKSKEQVVSLLGALGKDAAASIPTLLKYYQSNKIKNRKALKAISTMGEPGLLPMKELFNKEKSSLAAECLSQMGEKGVVFLASKLSSLNLQEKKMVVRRLSRCPKKFGKQVTPFLYNELGNSDEQYSRKLNDCLRWFHADAEASLPKISDLFLNSSQNSRTELFHVLVSIGQKSTPTFSMGLTSKSAEVRELSLRGLTELKRTESNVHDMVVKLLKKEASQSVRRAALRYLSAFEEQSNKSVPVLLRLATEGEDIDRSSALQALAKIGTKEACLALTKCLKSKNSKLWAGALNNLSSFTQYSELLYPALTKIIKDKKTKQFQTYTAINTLVKLKDQRKKIASFLLKISRDTKMDVAVRRHAIIGHKTFAKHSALITPPLLKLLKGKDRTLQAASCVTLGSVGVKDKVVLKALNKASLSKDSKVRQSAQFGLTEFHKR